MTKTLPISEVKTHLPELVRGAADRGDEIIITRKGRPAAVLLSVEELEGLRETLEIMSDPKLMAQIRRGEEYFRKGGKGYTIEEAFGS
ncbi:MAG: toxin-antitoxin system subunit antitoxin [Omnitrophica WOR_2 bacterium RIFCSPHIGHO2_02_FULL_68_15]|nr:MAG: toxin-antitoxin system subunit antitoxin [Nitrospirae bacterium RIFCSPLOWO2_12_FULL_63_8]OGX38412.1 MAG: toxin-antitoxin system subunit antitoxin [Omnitrophica WOR_2 bacterium RIFCSPHIGHO2_02_FULL_68_15]